MSCDIPTVTDGRIAVVDGASLTSATLKTRFVAVRPVPPTVGQLRRRSVRLCLAACVVGAGPLVQPRDLATAASTLTTDPEPITPIPQPPVADPLRLALGKRLFVDRRLSDDGTFIMPEENMPPHFANHSSAFRLQVRSPYPDMRLFLSEGRFISPANSSRKCWQNLRSSMKKQSCFVSGA
jgi:hypothetical protein